MKFKKLSSSLLAATMAFAIPISSSAYTSDLYEDFVSSEYIEDMAYEQGSGVDYDSVIVVNSKSLTSDGLSASGLVGASNGVVCCINSSRYNDSKKILENFLDGDKSRTVYFIGGEKVIPKSFKDNFRGYKCVTLAGANRIETSYKVANEIRKIKGNIDEIAITKGFGGEADSVSISYTASLRGMPVVLTNGKTVPFSTNGVDVYAIGGNAVISDALVNKTNAVRLGGKNRYETNKKIIKYFEQDQGVYSVCYGDNAKLDLAVLVGCLPTSSPLVLVSDNSDKSVLSGVSQVTYYSIIPSGPSLRLQTSCYNASIGGEPALNAERVIYKDYADSDFYIIAKMISPSECYLSNKPNFNSYKDDYYFFERLNHNGEETYLHILVRKSDNKIFTCDGYSIRPEPSR